MGFHTCTEDDLSKFNKDDDNNGQTRKTFENNYEKYVCLDQPEKVDLGMNGQNSSEFVEFEIFVVHCKGELGYCKENVELREFLKGVKLEIVHND